MLKKKLLVVESPAKIKTISKFLGADFNIVSTMGHIKDLPTNELGVTINGDINLEYVIIQGKEETIAKLAKAASSCDEIYLAPDPDREGEIIAWHAQQEIEKVAKKSSKIYRISFNEITKQAVLEALEHVSSVDLDKVAAQQARRVLDRWVGYEVSPVLWKKLGPGLSAGRVQSVALRLVCNREQEIRDFKPQEYWSITGTFAHSEGIIEAALTTIGTKKAEIGTKKEAEQCVAQIRTSQFSITGIADKQRTKNPLAPFITSSLQQDAFNRLGFSVQKTMQTAQKLYEGLPLKDPATPVALITYMRTDSVRVADIALSQARTFIKKTFGEPYLPESAQLYEKRKGKTQDAHEAIRPIDVNITPEIAQMHLPADAAKLYDLIWRRFVSCQMKPALYAQRQVTLKGGNFTFKVTGSTLTFDGFLKVYAVKEDEDEEQKVKLPAGIKEQDAVALKKIDPKQHFTQPPARYSEATLVKELEKEGIGRPSTYATILNTIKARTYVTVEKKRFIPTELGMAVTQLLVENLPDIMNIKFTAHMEEDLDKVAHGELERNKLLKTFYKAFEKDLQAFQGKDGKRILTPTSLTCPQCKKHPLVIRFGKAGEFLGCSGYPECTFTSNFKRNEQGEIEIVTAQETQKLLDEKCPQCGKQLRSLVGKFGPFIACSGYPECKYIKQEKAQFACPVCKGDLVMRKWRGGQFWGCSNYPKCTFAVFGSIVPQPCPKCGIPFLGKKVTKAEEFLFCADKKCGYKEPV